MGERTTKVHTNLNNIFSDEEIDDSHIGRRLRRMISEASRETAPPFPRQIQIETSNICNHSCQFCAYTLMERKKGYMDKGDFRRYVKEAYDLGAREIGLFAGAEPLTCKWLDEYIRVCSEIGYEYTYISTNGALGGPERFAKLLDAGLDSIKFSVNGGDRETYKAVHGKDNFDAVIETIRFVSEYREKIGRKVFLGVSFVGMPQTNHTFEPLKELVGDAVDEILYYEASNQSGQMPDFPDPPYRDCHLPFNKAHISREGFLKACCNDYENLLAIEDLNKMSMKDAWHSERFQALRQKHIDNTLDGTVCGNCIRGSKQPPAAINADLLDHEIFWGTK